MSMKMQINDKTVHKGYEDLWGSADLAPGILKFSARSRCVWLYNLEALPVGKTSRYPLSRRLDEAHSPCKHFGEKSAAHAGNRTTLSLSHGLLTDYGIPTALRAKAVDLIVLTLLTREN